VSILRRLLPRPCRAQRISRVANWRQALCLAFAALLPVANTCWSAYPDRPIRFIVPSSPGGSPDTLMRILTDELSRRLGVQFVVINKPAANYIVGTLEVARAQPDGYTLGYGNIVSLAINYSLLPEVPYDVEKDLTLISSCVRVSNLLAVNNDVPVRTVGELIAYARKHPGRLVMASAGNGTTGHLGGELFKSMAGISMLHVPYRGSPQAISDVIAGEAHVIFDNLASIGSYAKAGRVRPLGVSGPQRSTLFPDVPTIAEAGLPGYQTIAWGGVIGPAKLPREIVARLNREIAAALQSPFVRQRYAQLDTEPHGSSPEEFLELARRERPRWAEVIRRAGARLD
jgi:tripartite-type tricarboxylate transporter receptor subunit TctC